MQAGIAVGNLASIVGIRPEEAAILTELKAGSEEAFAWLIAQYHQPIYSLVARTVQNPADAPDVTQDIFIKVFRGISSFHGDSSLRTWIYRIALHETSKPAAMVVAALPARGHHRDRDRPKHEAVSPSASRTPWLTVTNPPSILLLMRNSEAGSKPNCVRSPSPFAPPLCFVTSKDSPTRRSLRS